MHRILMPVDGSLHSMKALKVATDLSVKYHGCLYILHILLRGRTAHDLMALDISKNYEDRLRTLLQKAEVAKLGPAPEEVLNDVGQVILSDAAERAERYGAEFKLLPIADGSPASVILTSQRTVDAGTIVMGARGITDRDSTTFGSVSQAVFRQAECTCISVK